MNYYKDHSKEYIANTFSCDMSEQHSFFEKHLKEKSTILDIGFGSGRDSLYFKNKGYDVYSIDPEESFVAHAKEIGLQNVYQSKAEEIGFAGVFDGIWACASLLHIPSKDLKDVFKKCCTALKENGIMYVSFKQGDSEGERDGRFYLDLTEPKLKSLLEGTGLAIQEIKITKDVRSDREDVWLNALLVKLS